MLAANSGHLSIARVLVDNKADVTLKDSFVFFGPNYCCVSYFVCCRNNWTAFDYAIRKNRLDVVKFLRTVSISLIDQHDKVSSSILFEACN